MKPKTIREILEKTPCIDSYCGGQGGTWQGDPENPEPVQCQFCYQERYPFIEEALAQIQQLLEECAPEMRTDTRGATQNPDNQKYLTKAAMAHNQAIDQYKSNLMEKMK